MGVGAVSVRLPGTNDIYVINPVYLAPKETPNTLSSGDMKFFYVFNITHVNPLEYCDFIYHYRNNFSCATTIKCLDDLKLKLIKPNHI